MTPTILPLSYATKRISVDIGVDANPLSTTEIDLDSLGLLRCGSGRTRRIVRYRTLHPGSETGLGDMDWDQTPNRRRAMLLRTGFLATSATVTPDANVSATIRAFASADQRRRRTPLARSASRIDPLTSCLDSRSHASSISQIKQGGPHRMDTYFFHCH
jgi:hypothetical protein